MKQKEEEEEESRRRREVSEGGEHKPVYDINMRSRTQPFILL